MDPALLGNQLRVAQIIGSFERGGAERQAYNLVLGLRDLGVDARGIAVRRAGDFVAWGGDSGAFEDLGADRKRPWTLVRAASRLRSIVKRWQPQVLHVQGTDSLPFVWLALRGLRARPRVLFTWQDSNRVLGQEGRARHRMRNAIRRCDWVFGSSSDVARRLAEAAGIPRVDVFHGGVPEQPATQPSGPIEILWIARFDSAKDPEVLVRALARLRDMGGSFRAVMVGGAHPGSSYLDDVRRQARDLQLEGILKLPGYVEQEDLERHLESAAIGVQSSRTEGLSMVLLEQMMRGLAIVATDVGDTSIALDGGRCGILIPADGDQERLATELRRLVEDAASRSSLGLAARKRALTCYSIAAMSKRARDIYAQAVHASKVAPG